MEKEKFKESQGTNIAVDVAIFNSKNEILLGKRLTKVGYGTWAFPGGHLKTGERLNECAQREIIEELGDEARINISNEILSVRENRIPPFYIPHLTIILKGTYKGGEIKVVEPEMCSEWRFFKIEDISEYPLFSGVTETLENFLKQRAVIVTDWH